MSNQEFFPNVVINTVRNSNTAVNAQKLTGGTLSSQYDLQAHRIVKAISTPRTSGLYFVIDPVMNAPLQLSQGDIITSLAVYGPELTGGTSIQIARTAVPVFDTTTGVPLTPGIGIPDFICAAIPTADAVAGRNAALTSTDAVGAANQWLSISAVGNYTAGSVGLVLTIFNPAAVLL